MNTPLDKLTRSDGDGKSVSVGFQIPPRYDKDIFYLTPFYHEVFAVEKMIFSDVDVAFKVVTFQNMNTFNADKPGKTVLTVYTVF